MAIQVQCAGCGKVYQLRDDMGGKKVKCKCGAGMVVPRTQAAPARESEVGAAGIPDPMESLFDEEFSDADAGPLLAPATAPLDQGGGARKKRSASAPGGKPAGESGESKGKTGGGSSTLRTVLIVVGAAVGGVAIIGLIVYLITWTPKPGFPTPQEAFAAHQQALAADDWATLFGTYTPESQKTLAAAMVIFAAGRDKTAPEVKDTLAKHGIQNLLDSELPDAATLGQTLAVADRTQLFTDLVLALDAMEERKAYNPVLKVIARKDRIAAREASAGAKLSGVAITGTTATGTLTVTIGSRTVEAPVTFRQIDGLWLIDGAPGGAATSTAVLGVRAPFP